MTQPSYTCPRCGMVSYNPNDLANRYCGHCHRFEVQDVTDFTAKTVQSSRLKKTGEYIRYKK